MRGISCPKSKISSILLSSFPSFSEASLSLSLSTVLNLFSLGFLFSSAIIKLSLSLSLCVFMVGEEDECRRWAFVLAVDFPIPTSNNNYYFLGQPRLDSVSSFSFSLPGNFTFLSLSFPFNLWLSCLKRFGDTLLWFQATVVLFVSNITRKSFIYTDIYLGKIYGFLGKISISLDVNMHIYTRTYICFNSEQLKEVLEVSFLIFPVNSLKFGFFLKYREF